MANDSQLRQGLENKSLPQMDVVLFGGGPLSYNNRPPWHGKRPSEACQGAAH